MTIKMKTPVPWLHEPLAKWLGASLSDLADLSHCHCSRKFSQMTEVGRGRQKGLLETLYMAPSVKGSYMVAIVFFDE